MSITHTKNNKRNHSLVKHKPIHPPVNKQNKHNHLLINMDDNENDKSTGEYSAIFERSSRKSYLLRLIAIV